MLFLSLSCAAGPRPMDRAGLAHFTFHAPDARQVSLAGSFNRWDPAAHLMTGPDRNGNWNLEIPLAPGRYEYLYLINGAEWVPDPAAPSADDGFGGRNSVLDVPR